MVVCGVCYDRAAEGVPEEDYGCGCPQREFRDGLRENIDEVGGEGVQA